MDYNTKEMFGLTDKNFIADESWFEKRMIAEEECFIIKGKWINDGCYCPSCSSKKIIKHTPMPRKIILPKYRERKTYLELQIQRYRCKDCDKVFSASCPLTDPYKNLSKEVMFNILLQLKEGVSRKYLGKLYGVSDKMIERVMQKFQIKTMQQYHSLPRVLCLDEFRGVTTAAGNMNFICLDGETHQLIDILPSRSLNDLVAYFMKFSYKVRKRVKYLVMDMNASYGELVRRVFPNAMVVVDRFHIVQHINRNFNQLRIQVMKQFPRKSSEYKNLKRYWKLLLKDYNQLDSETIQYNKFLRRPLTQTQLVELLISFDEHLEEAYEYIQALKKAYNNRNYKEFMKQINECPKTLPYDFRRKFKTFMKFKDGIREALRLPYSNGPVEGVNNLIKVIKRVAYGYRNFMNMKTRIKIITGVYYR